MVRCFMKMAQYIRVKKKKGRPNGKGTLKLALK
jgi:hypothetical protein